MASQDNKPKEGPLWAARLAVILIAAMVIGAGIAMYVVLRGPR